MKKLSNQFFQIFFKSLRGSNQVNLVPLSNATLVDQRFNNWADANMFVISCAMKLKSFSKIHK